MKNLIPQYILRQFAIEKSSGSFYATTMFVDISGFTALTESLMRQGTEGAEVLSEILDLIFAPMVTKVYAKGGEIPHFAGDAFTAIFVGNQAEKVAALAHDIRDSFDQNPVFETKFGHFRMNIRIGLSYGEVSWGIIGDRLKTFYFRGNAIDQAAFAQQKAVSQEIVMDSAFQHILMNQDPTLIEKEERYTTVSKQEKERAFASFLPQSVVNFNGKGEFRDVVSVFISFANVISKADLEDYATIVLEQFESFGGYFKELDFGDKGGLMVGFWGAPTAYENNLTRALECILAIKDELSHLQVHRSFKFRAGVTSGVAYAGMIGGMERCQYAVVGSRVNLAARLALQANWNETLVDKHVLHAKTFDFQEKGNLRYKGFSEKVPTFKLLKKKMEERPFFIGDMIGRDTELHHLVELTASTLTNKSAGIAYIWGEPGIGKSRLTFELRHQIEKFLKVTWAVCQSDQILRKPFNSFIYFLKNYFKQSVEQTPTQNKTAFEWMFENLVRSLPESAYTEGAELIRTRFVLAALVGLNYPDSLWEQLDARGRYDNTLAAIENLLKALAQVQPLVIEVEDAHWLDADSHVILQNFARHMTALPILIVATMRYDDEGNKNGLFGADILRGGKTKFTDIDLNVLSPQGLKELAESKLKGEVHPDFSEMLWRTTNGNPFYIEQILAYFAENNLLQKIDNQYTVKDTNIRISTSISAILTARIDRLSSILKETVKAAAVIGREFELPVLSEVILQHDEYVRRNGNGQIVLREQIQSAEKGQIWRAMNELRYIFRHSLLREAVYDMQLKTRLRELHFMIAKAIEKVYSNNIEQRYVDLAFHYEQAEVKSKTLEYLRKAADFARRNYQNQQALDFYDRLLKNIENETELVKTLIKKGEVLQLVGRWYDSEIAFHEALFKAAATGNINLKGRTNSALGTLLMLKGNYEEARPYLEKAASYFEQVIDSQGIARAYGSLGNLYFRQGEYDLAKDYFSKSIHISREHGLRSPAQIVSNLGLTYMNQGDYTEGVKTQREELEIAEKNNDLAGAATLWVNLGIVYFEKGDENAALRCFEKGLELCQLLGNKQFTSIALGCIGNVWRVKGNFEKAAGYLTEDLKMCNELGDRQGIAIAHELIGKLYSTKGEFNEAKKHFEESLTLCRQINYQKGIAKALHSLTETFSYHNDFLKALEYCDEAIGIARKINNQLILGQCLVEKAHILLKAGDYYGAKLLQTETVEVAEKLGNEKLSQQVQAFLKKI
ncbi:MAG: tetratricopeptide repeat protein [Saprospiraceae bacterium]|nr:tetratricopeptide repeat protein [Saprospiraceae bacterium]